MVKKPLAFGDLVSNDLEVEIVELFESYSEDEDFQLRRKKGVPSRTPEITTRLRQFYVSVGRYTEIALDASTSVGKRQRRILISHLSMLCRCERDNDEVKCFIAYATPPEMFCSVLLEAGTIELESDVGKVICHLDKGIRLCRMASMFKAKRVIKPTDDQFQSVASSLTEWHYDTECPISTIFLLIDLHECNGRLLVLDIVRNQNGTEDKVLSYGDSHRFTCPK